MQERFLHYVWQYQYFDKEELTTTTGENLKIQSPGFLNPDAGPDFSESKITINDIEWRGSVEIHITSSDWARHDHTTNKAYDNVVLHVVWNDDKEVYRSDGSLIPVFELKDRINATLLQKYEILVQQSPETIPCEQSFESVPDILKLEMLDRVVMERLEFKSSTVLELLKANNGDWEETSYQLLFRSFGLKVNVEPFGRLAQLLPYRIIKKHVNNLEELESLLFGVAGFLEDNKDDEYYQQLIKKYAFLKHKYDLHTELDKSEWKFLRLRPANFPSLRIAQLAALLKGNPNLFNVILNTPHIKGLGLWLGSSPSVYWKNHYNFGDAAKRSSYGIGKSTKDIIIINTIVPIVAAYSRYINEQKYMDQVLDLLENIKAESNHIIQKYKLLGFRARSVLDSQGLIQLYTNYCTKKQCLKCSIGNHIIKPR